MRLSLTTMTSWLDSDRRNMMSNPSNPFRRSGGRKVNDAESASFARRPTQVRILFPALIFFEYRWKMDVKNPDKIFSGSDAVGLI